MDFKTLTIRNVQIDFLLGSFFRENITQNRNGGDVVGPEVALPFAKITNIREKACWISRTEFCHVKKTNLQE